MSRTENFPYIPFLMHSSDSIELAVANAFSRASGREGVENADQPADLFLDNRQTYERVWKALNLATDGGLEQQYVREGFYFRPIADLIARVRRIGMDVDVLNIFFVQQTREEQTVLAAKDGN